jgi:hypothetical protein
MPLSRADRRKITASIKAASPAKQRKTLIIPQVGNVKTDETDFGGFVTMPLGIFSGNFGPSQTRRFLFPSETCPSSEAVVHIQAARPDAG